MTSGWKHLDVPHKASLIERHHKFNSSARTLAEAISGELHDVVTRNAIVGFYMRNPEIKLTHPLGLAPARKRKRDADKRTETFNRDAEVKREKVKTKLAARIELPEPDGPYQTTDKEQREINEAYDLTAKRVELHELSSCQCHWPVNDGGPFLFCGHDNDPDQHYCPTHTARGSRPAPKYQPREHGNRQTRGIPKLWR